MRRIFKPCEAKIEQAGSIENHYQALFKKFGDSYEAVQYTSKESQLKRFDTLIKVADLTRCTVLDFGCGLGHFLEFLRSQHQSIEKYIGIEIVPEMLTFARNKYPDASFFLPTELTNLSFDYGFVCGTFNNKMKNNRSFWQDTIVELFSKCKKGIAFNMMSTYVDFQDRDLFYENPEYVFKFVKDNLTPYVTLRHDFETKKHTIPFEFVIYAYKFPNNES